MWKWIGIAALVIVGLVGTCVYVGYRQLQKFANSDSSQTTVIDARPERVFSSLATGDSLWTWMTSGSVHTTRKGTLRAGDTVFTRSRGTGGQPAQSMNWIVTEASAPRSLSLEMTASNDSGGALKLVRRFAVEARGDSTAVTSTVVMPGGDSAMARAVGADSASGGAAGAMMGFAAKMMLAALRMQSNLEVRTLKSHIEGKPMGIEQLKSAPPAPSTKTP